MGEIRALTSLRGIAAIVVFFAHTRETLEARGLHIEVSTLVQRFFFAGGRQVDIFFVLSGFILALIYSDWFATSVTRAQYVKFIQRRFARIYPLHCFMILLVVASVSAAHLFHFQTMNGLDRYDYATLPAYFLLVQAWGFLGDNPGEWNPPAWSVSIEALAYLLFPFFLWLTARPEKTRPWTVLLAIIACGFLLNSVTHWGMAAVPGTARGLSEFALGCATVPFLATPATRWLQSPLGSATAVAFIAIVFALTPDTGFIIGLSTAPLLLALCGNNPISRALGNPVLYFLGEISFSIYLGHFLYSTIAYRLVSVPWMKNGPLQLVVGFSGIVLFVLVASTITYFAVERPGRDLLRGRKASPPPERVGSV
jgi:peptidoglycan/LPS O-acetylase OafA/YrhL